MFSVRFRRPVRVRRRRHRNAFCFSHKNRSSYTIEIWHKKAYVSENVLDDLSLTLTQGHGCGVDVPDSARMTLDVDVPSAYLVAYYGASYTQDLTLG